MRPTDTLIRASLWLSFPFNLLAAFALAWPATLPGRLMGLPDSVPPLYAALGGFLVALFGFAYAWLALRTHIDRPLLGFAACGKAGVFALAASLWIARAGSGATLLVATGDLLLAVLWFWWLVASPPQAARQRAP